ncbi:MAG: hypothetical protein WD029_10315 [Microthrixaceae bacterium]
MTEVLSEPLYPFPGRPEVDEDGIVIIGKPSGAAGISTQEFEDGSIWQVDHLQPERFVSIQVPKEGTESSPLLLTAFGSDATKAIAEHASNLSADHSELSQAARFADPSPDSFGRGSRSFSEQSLQAGRLILLSDLAYDSSLHPLAQITAGLQLLAEIPFSPVVQLFSPITQRILQRTELLAATVDTDDLELLEVPYLLFLAKESAVVARLSPTTDSPLEALSRQSSEQLGGVRQHQHLQTKHIQVLANESEHQIPGLEESKSASASQGQPHLGPTEEFIELVWSHPSVLTVKTTRHDNERWVRVLRREGLVLLAMAPLQLDGLLDSAEVILPMGLTEEDIHVQIVFTNLLPTSNPGSLERWNKAVHAGRTAARATRLGDEKSAQGHWEQCADLWKGLDKFRGLEASEMAWDRFDFGSPAALYSMKHPLIVDQVAGQLPTELQ